MASGYRYRYPDGISAPRPSGYLNSSPSVRKRTARVSEVPGAGRGGLPEGCREATRGTRREEGAPPEGTAREARRCLRRRELSNCWRRAGRRPHRAFITPPPSRPRPQCFTAAAPSSYSGPEDHRGFSGRGTRARFPPGDVPGSGHSSRAPPSLSQERLPHPCSRAPG